MRRHFPESLFIAVVILGAVFLLNAFVYGVDADSTQADDVISAREALEYDAADSRDPFEGPFDQQGSASNAAGESAEDNKPPELNIQGIVWGQAGNSAIINSQVVRTGDSIEGVKITGIDKNGVVAIYKGKQIILDAPAKKMTGSAQNKEGGTNE